MRDTDPSDPRATTVRILVPNRCRRWARASRVPLHDLLQSLVDFGALVLDVLPASLACLPRPAHMLSAVSILSLDPHPGTGDQLPADERAALGAGRGIDGCPKAYARLRAYAASCLLVHPDLAAANLAYLVTGYALSIGVPASAADAAAQAVAGALDPGSAGS